jgi:hypothetical protein
VNSEAFYDELEPFHRFVEEVFEPRFYAPLPSDWIVVVADITSSSQAVAEGRYKQVNYLGTACIVAVNNALDGMTVPTVFGGDGATVAVPASLRDKVVTALIATQRWGREVFDLALRVGVVPVAELERRGACIEVGKLEFSPGNTMAMFRGAGFDLADDIIKTDDGSQGYLVTVDNERLSRPDLSNLWCRWAPIEPEHGVMLCLILGARTDVTAESDDVYRQALTRIDSVVRLSSAAASPVKADRFHMRLRMAAVAKEVASRRGPWLARWPPVLLTHAAQVLLFRFNLRIPNFDPTNYKREITVNADFRKVIGKLRLIIDCGAQQADAIEAALAELTAAGKLNFGSHRASHAIMTCVTPDPTNNDHVHYIDGAEGGLWSAADALKRRTSGNG